LTRERKAWSWGWPPIIGLQLSIVSLQMRGDGESFSSGTELASPSEITAYWFGDEYYKDPTMMDDRQFYRRRSKALWFKSSAEIDQEIRERFMYTIKAGKSGLLSEGLWEENDGQIAKVILFDQFTRNCFRGTAEAFSCDEEARRISRAHVGSGRIFLEPLLVRQFMLLPLEHSEVLEDQDLLKTTVESLIESAPEDQKDVYKNIAKASNAHRDIIVRFGRYPHRNAILERRNTVRFLTTN